ncbi:ATP-binding protein [Pontibacter liquoris]|uniref:ATP-binding protein n=1 Tax=Pontibacter liquoris TaxID=2905677 RepID=UPI001FA7F792|nr:ATP-binding protein [Pontibacter liquoris]
MTDQEREIGRVIGVESDKVLIELNHSSKSLTKTFVTGVYPIARINSYVLLPIGSVCVVAVVTRVSMAKESVELTSEATLSLPQPKRTLSATMVGTLEAKNHSQIFSFGISQFPALDNPVWFILEQELDTIFDKHSTADDHYFLEVGTSTAYPSYHVKVNPDKLLSRHLGVLGNTGAGKSSTIASLLQSILNHEEVSRGEGAHFILFDTNGEYHEAFKGNPNFDVLYISSDELRLPYWFMNFEDWVHLLQPKEGSQIPTLSKALLYARNPDLKPEIVTPTQINSLLDDAKKHFMNLKDGSDEDKYDYVLKKHKGVGSSTRMTELSTLVKNYIQSKSVSDGKQENKLKDVDTPSFFSLHKLRHESIDMAIQESGSSSSQIRSHCETMLQRMDRFFRDPRYEFLFHEFAEQDFAKSLSNFMRLCLGRMEKADHSETSDTDDYYFLNKFKEHKKNYQVVIFDLNLIPSDILQNVTALLGRLILEFLQRIEKVEEYKGKDVRGKCPYVLVLEEAHNYIPKATNREDKNVSREVFERIAREGRKYGLSLVVSSQRPSELSTTVLSQCNSYIVHRIQNPEDQEYIRKLLPSVSQDLLKQIPILGQGVGLIFGDCVRAPMQIKVKEPAPKPKSNDPDYWKHWTNAYSIEDDYPFDCREPNFEKVCQSWEKEYDNTDNQRVPAMPGIILEEFDPDVLYIKSNQMGSE